MKHLIPLALATLAPLAVAQNITETPLVAQNLIEEPILHEMTITSVTGTYAMHTDELLISGTGLNAANTVTIDGQPTILLEKRYGFLRVRGPAVGEPGFWPVTVTSNHQVVTAMTEYWPMLTVERLGVLQPAGECSAMPRFRTELREAFALELHNGGTGNYWFAMSLEQRLLPVQLFYPLSGYEFWLEEPFAVVGMGSIPPSGIVREKFRLPPQLLGQTLYFQGWAQHHDMLESCGGMCFSNMTSLPL